MVSIFLNMSFKLRLITGVLYSKQLTIGVNFVLSVNKISEGPLERSKWNSENHPWMDVYCGPTFGIIPV